MVVTAFQSLKKKKSRVGLGARQSPECMTSRVHDMSGEDGLWSPAWPHMPRVSLAHNGMDGTCLRIWYHPFERSLFGEVTRVVGLLSAIGIGALLHTLRVIIISTVTASPGGLVIANHRQLEFREMQLKAGRLECKNSRQVTRQIDELHASQKGLARDGGG